MEDLENHALKSKYGVGNEGGESWGFGEHVGGLLDFFGFFSNFPGFPDRTPVFVCFLDDEVHMESISKTSQR